MSMSPLKPIAKVATVLAATAALSAVVALPSPANASSFSSSKSSGRMVSTQWVEVGVLTNAAGAQLAPGNVHLGDLTVTSGLNGGTVRPSGIVFDLECPTDDDGNVVVPPHWGGGHGAAPAHEFPPTEPLCEKLGVRFIHGGTLRMTMDRKLTTARVTGTLAVHNGETEAAAPMDVTWTGIGATYSSSQRGTESFDGQTWTYRYSFTGRSASVAGRMGPMDFTDDADDVSSGRMGTYKDASRSRTR